MNDDTRSMDEHLDSLYLDGIDPYGLGEDFTPEEAEQQHKQFTIDDLGKAEWAAGIVAISERRQEARNDWLNDRIENLKAIVKAENAADEARSSFLKTHLHTFLRKEIEAGHPNKSMRLPAGTIGLRSSKDKLAWDKEQEQAIIEYLEGADEVAPVKVSKSILKTKLDEVTTRKGTQVILDATGEPLPGVHVEPGDETFSFKVTKEE